MTTRIHTAPPATALGPQAAALAQHALASGLAPQDAARALLAAGALLLPQGMADDAREGVVRAALATMQAARAARPEAAP